MASVKKSCARHGCTTRSCTKHGWQVRWSGPDGKTPSATFDTKTEAEAKAREVEASKLDGSYISPAQAKITVAAFAKLYLKGETARTEVRRWRRSTRASRTSDINLHVTPTLGNRKIGTVTQPQIQALVDAYAQTHKATSTASFYNTLRSLFSHAVKDARIARTPCVDVTLPEPQRCTITLFTTTQALTLARAVPAPFKVVILLMALLGLRISEALAVSETRIIRDLHGTPVRLIIDRQVSATAEFAPPKTRRSNRTLPIPPTLATAITDHLATYGSLGTHTTTDGQTETALVGWDGKLMNRHTFDRKIWKPALKATGLKGTPHALRHAWCTMLLEAGRPALAVAAWAGHTVTELERTYFHLLKTADDTMIDTITAAFDDPDADNTDTDTDRPDTDGPGIDGDGEAPQAA